MADNRSIEVKPEIAARAHVTAEQYRAMYERAASDPNGYWAEEARRIPWIKPPTRIKNTSFTGDVPIRWFEDGTLNASACCLDRHLADRPDQIAIIWEGDDPNTQKTITYRALHEQVCRCANALKSLGVKKGDVVTIYLPMVIEAAIAMLACARIGAIHSVVFGGFSPDSLANRIQDCNSTLLITADEGRRGGRRVALKANADEALTSCPSVRDVVVVRVTGADVPMQRGRDHSAEALLANASPDCPPEPMNAEDPLFILYTSGTTGKPKGAELTHFNLFMCCQVSADRLVDFRDDDVGLGVLPLFHSFGQSNVMNTTLYAGGTMTLVPRFDADKVMEVIQRDKVTIFLGVPTMYFALLHHPRAGEYDISSLRLCVSGGASMPGEVMKAFEQKFGATILEGYGLSETSPSASFNRSSEERKFLSIGKPVWGVEMRIHDENDEPMGSGKENVGEIVIRGHNVMKGYFKKPEATAEAMKNGWFHSGDMGYVDADGFFFIVDRKKELIIRGGFNVYPREVEEVLYAHPAVQEAAVIGISDEKLGEEVKAVVALKQGQMATEEELIAWTKERVAAYKYPRSVQFVDTLPKARQGRS